MKELLLFPMQTLLYKVFHATLFIQSPSANILMPWSMLCDLRGTAWDTVSIPISLFQ